MNRLPPLGQALEWADSKEVAQRLQNLRYSLFCGWHSEWRPEPDPVAALPAPSRRIVEILLGKR